MPRGKYLRTVLVLFMLFTFLTLITGFNPLQKPSAYKASFEEASVTDTPFVLCNYEWRDINEDPYHEKNEGRFNITVWTNDSNNTSAYFAFGLRIQSDFKGCVKIFDYKIQEIKQSKCLKTEWKIGRYFVHPNMELVLANASIDDSCILINESEPIIFNEKDFVNYSNFIYACESTIPPHYECEEWADKIHKIEK